MLAFTLIITSINQVLCLYETSNLVHLTQRNFDKLVTHGDDTWMIQFYSSMCPYCQDFAPSFEHAAEVLNGTVRAGVVDADEDKVLLSRYSVKNVPAVKIYDPGFVAKTYEGPRTVEGLVKELSMLFNETIRRKLYQRLKAAPLQN